MTTFRHGRTRAHVMEWSGGRQQWESVCHRDSLNVRPAEWIDRDGYVGVHDRLVPWCSGCVSYVRQRVERLTEDVIAPAAQEAGNDE